VQAAPVTDRRRGWRKGEPTAFARGHTKNGLPVRGRLLAGIVYMGDCWLWQGAQKDGYGLIRVAGRMRSAHRASYETFVGPIPPGLEIDHLCRNHACIYPAHLEPVTHGENVRRGSAPTADNARKTHCLRGHPLSGDNLYIFFQNGKKSRACKACRKTRKRGAAKRKQAA
jgi:hypothetical protein